MIYFSLLLPDLEKVSRSNLEILDLVSSETQLRCANQELTINFDIILSIKSQRDELYDNHSPFLDVASHTFDLSDHRISLLDGHFDWYKNLFLYYQFKFVSMRSQILEFMIWSDGWSMIKNHFRVKWSIRLTFNLVQVLRRID